MTQPSTLAQRHPLLTGARRIGQPMPRPESDVERMLRERREREAMRD